MESNITGLPASWAGRRVEGLAFLLAGAAVSWAAVLLSAHTADPAPLDSDVTDADLARLGAAVMAAVAAVSAGLWWRHRAAAHHPAAGGGWARAAFAVSCVHALLLVPVITFAPWGWKVPLIVFTAAVLAGGVREAAAATASADGRIPLPAPASG
ncbi:hypothetical protein [Streptomyces sp. HUAS TT20]|uniref:hypothetical protein n=1 Tax=Streptomyces sp. HUAS TT20 TaxID=3447509 RepID=UPI0021DB4E80|nr:hypothetical protein [Streptomyces sp. HUAS 15-9]UXY25337.1 hypothetical protein N8I87_01305 [Streptomyces sp. HUAS 15-9]